MPIYFETADLRPPPQGSIEMGKLFQSERQMLDYLPRLLRPDLTTPEERRQFLYRHIEDLSSTQMAEHVFRAYGFHENFCQTDQQLASAFHISEDTVGNERRLVMHTLWELHKNLFPQKTSATQQGCSFAETLSQRYEIKGHTKERKRALANICYYADRQKLMTIEDSLLDFIPKLYDRETEHIFSMYYRLGKFRQRKNFERCGCFPPNKLRSQQEFQKIEDALEAGRAAAEKIMNISYGRYAWTGMDGNQTAGYRRKGKHFPAVVAFYLKQGEMAQRINEPVVHSALLPVERELIGMTTSARLNGGRIADGLRAFNRKYKIRINRHHLSRVTKKIENLSMDREISSEDSSQTPTKEVLITLQRKIRMGQLAEKGEWQRKVVAELKDMLISYHLRQANMAELAEYYELPYTYACGVRTLLERMIITQNNPGVIYSRAPDSFERGELKPDEVNRFFNNDNLPNPILLIISQFAKDVKYNRLRRYLAKGERLKFTPHKKEIHGLRMFLENIAAKLEE